MSIKSTINGFFSTANYDQAIKDNGWASQFESAADICRAPSRWFAGEVFTKGKTYTISKNVQVIDSKPTVDSRIPADSFTSTEKNIAVCKGAQRIIRFIASLIFSLPGQALAVPLMAIAYTNKEIRLKHTFVSRALSEDEKTTLNQLIQNRQTNAQEVQGDGESSCLLCSICCLLCCLVFAKK